MPGAKSGSQVHLLLASSHFVNRSHYHKSGPALFGLLGSPLNNSIVTLKPLAMLAR